MSINELPWDTLGMFSDTALDSFILVRENELANLKRSIRAELEILSKITAELEVARSIRRSPQLAYLLKLKAREQPLFLLPE